MISFPARSDCRRRCQPTDGGVGDTEGARDVGEGFTSITPGTLRRNIGSPHRRRAPQSLNIVERKTVKKCSTLGFMSDRVAFSDRVAVAVLATSIGAMSVALVVGLVGGMTWHDQRLFLLLASMLIALYALVRDDERLILLALGALVALYVPFVVFG